MTICLGWWETLLECADKSSAGASSCQPPALLADLQLDCFELAFVSVPLAFPSKRCVRLVRVRCRKVCEILW